MNGDVKIRLVFKRHPVTNHTDGYGTIGDLDCEHQRCACEDPGYCCGNELYSRFCPDCGDEVERDYCYPCNGESCDCEITVAPHDELTYSGTVTAEWKNGELCRYTASNGHPHLNGTYCLGNASVLFENVRTVAQAIEAVTTHISNVDLNDGLGGTYDGLGVE